jgi:hypothetical protein
MVRMSLTRIRKVAACFIAVLFFIDALPVASAARAGLDPHTFERIFVIVLENRDYDDVQNHPYFAALAQRGQLLTNYWALTHPSQPNYVAMIFGDPMGIVDSTVTDIPGRNLVDQLEEHGISWKTYQENYPGNCYTPKYESDLHLYGRKHNPFISADTVRTDPIRCAKIVDGAALDADIATNALPQFSFYAPNANNNSHDTDIPTAAAWLAGFLEPKLTDPSFTKDTLVVVMWDEGSGTLPAPSQVSAILLAPSIRPGSRDSRRYDHYSLLRMIQNNWNLGTLGRHDDDAMPIRPMLRSTYLPQTDRR